jgi:hypothetical protein
MQIQVNSLTFKDSPSRIPRSFLYSSIRVILIFTPIDLKSLFAITLRATKDTFCEILAQHFWGNLFKLV